MNFFRKCIKYLFRNNKKETYSLRDVFTPSSCANLTFVEREKIHSEINRVLDTKGQQLVIYGHSGVGKSTLIRNTLDQKSIDYIVTDCLSLNTINDIIIDAFDQMDEYYTKEIQRKSDCSISTELKSEFSSIKTSILKSDSVKSERVITPQITPQSLVRFLGAANLVWVIDDFHKIKIEERTAFSQILKLFVNASNKYPNIRVITIGAVGSARDIIAHDPELITRISECQVPLMSNEELCKIIETGAILLNIEFPKEIKDNIVSYSHKLGALTHQFAFNICHNNNIKDNNHDIKVFTAEDFTRSLEECIMKISDTLKKKYDKAITPLEGKRERPIILLNALCQIKKDEISLSDIKKERFIKTEFKGSILTYYLDLFCTEEFHNILGKNAESQKYFFTDPFFKAFCDMMFSKDPELESINKRSYKTKQTIEIDVQELINYLHKLPIINDKIHIDG